MVEVHPAQLAKDLLGSPDFGEVRIGPESGRLEVFVSYGNPELEEYDYWADGRSEIAVFTQHVMGVKLSSGELLEVTNAVQAEFISRQDSDIKKGGGLDG
ncbi:MAG: hypothetical protein R3313_04035 [Candidatus Saccharimonadales bacterium]|nr:hypothetical protein [Candidatus Saccharimonadales bacterium]